MLVACINTDSQIPNEKRLLITDPDYTNNQQMQRDIQILKATMSQLQASFNTLNNKITVQDKQIQSQTSVITAFQNNPSGSIYVRWGRKDCPTNSTEMVYSGIGAGGYYVFGMEYQTNDFGSNLIDKDIPCAVCRVNHASTVLMIPGKSRCYNGWKIEYSGNLMSGHYSHAGASRYLCVDGSPDVLESGSNHDDAYLLYGVKAYCGSLKCPPYHDDSRNLTGLLEVTLKSKQLKILDFFLSQKRKRAKIYNSYMENRFIYTYIVITHYRSFYYNKQKKMKMVKNQKFSSSQSFERESFSKYAIFNSTWLFFFEGVLQNAYKFKYESSIRKILKKLPHDINLHISKCICIGGGGSYDNPGRNSNPICVPHDPDLGQVSHESAFGTVFGMEYETNDFGSNLIDKDVPCAVCRVNHASTVLMIPGKSHCLSGWKTEYSGNLMSGHHGHPGASQYLCVDNSPDILEGGARNDNGYILYAVKAYCGSLKCPPYVIKKSHNSISDRLTYKSHPSGSTYVRWGRKECPTNSTEMIYSERQNKSFTVFGMEYETNVFGCNLIDKDVPCAVCRVNHASTTIMIPGKSRCYPGWETEYSGNLILTKYIRFIYTTLDEFLVGQLKDASGVRLIKLDDSKYLTKNPAGSVYVRWGWKECPTNGTEIVYTADYAGLLFFFSIMTRSRRNTNPVCVPHDPDLGQVSHESYFGEVYGMEYETNDFGSNLREKDVPCAVCRVNHASTVLMIPGKSHCYSGWKTEYGGNLMSGHYGHAGGSQYVCVDRSPDVLEAGSRDDNGYLLYAVKAFCGSLKCPPYPTSEQNVRGSHLEMNCHTMVLPNDCGTCIRLLCILKDPVLAIQNAKADGTMHSRIFNSKYTLFIIYKYDHDLREQNGTKCVGYTFIIYMHIQYPPGSVYVRWGRKECPNNSTEMVYSGIGAGGHFTNSGRPTNQVCVPHDPDLGQVSHGSYFGTVYGMEYETNDFGSNLMDKDVPCAVCRVSHASTILMIPGKSQCYAGWKTEYSGNLMSGHYGHAGGSQYICVDSRPDVLEAGSRDDNGYLLYGAKAYCGSLKCPPYVQDTFFKCVVCSR
ncbi:Hypothetical predicted protein [Mytilus galloprovincialis]|uniref:Short-chain collagen C4 n=1 Tax=Mytilus galloprovincialis TaxID=29158 RepID=A0A8B6FL40_MYTGA|nr:Hypothetical predicted protein [Mytilus galloprovincialis]